MITITEKESKTIYVMKAISLLSVFFAHMPGENHYTEPIREILGLIGVVTFFILSGFLFSRPTGRQEIILFVKKKVKTILLPWGICSFGTYLISIFINKNKVSVQSMIRWMLGLNTWYYYLTVLVICYFVFSIKLNRTVCIAAIGLNVISLLLTGLKVLDLSDSLTNYLNVFNWIGFFVIGILFRRYGSIQELSKSMKCLMVGVWCISLGGFYILPIAKTYWSLYAAVFEILSLGIVYILAERLCGCKALVSVGKNSFFIYLIHMQFVGFLNTRIGHNDNAVILLLKPIVAFVLISGMIVIGISIVKKLKGEKLFVIFGIR